MSAKRSPPAGVATPARSLSWRRWIEPWYVAYAFQGATAAGLIPIVVPLVVSRAGSPADVGIVMAALSLGGLTAPLWGTLADRYRLHRWLLAGGLLVVAAGLAAFSATGARIAWLGLALAIGVATAASVTVANLFIVEVHPKAEWDERIGWLQTFYGGGQVAGLLLAGALSAAHPRADLLVAAGLALAAVLPGWFRTETPKVPLAPKPVLLRPVLHSETLLTSPQRSFHHLDAAAWRRLKPLLRSRFGLFAAFWLLSFAGAAAIFSLYPVLMQEVFGVPPGLSSAAFALAATLGLALYSPAGRWAERLGSAHVLRLGLGVRLIAFAGMLALGQSGFVGSSWLALLCFALVVLAWSLLSVSGTALAAELSPVGQGEAMGVFNATTAVAGVVGASLGGWVAGRWGYSAAPILAVVGVASGLLLALI